MALAYRTKDGDTVDLICWHIYGRTSGIVEQVLNANPSLASLGPLLPAGTLVALPTIEEPTQTDQVTLW
jgi:phage tail protein X